MKKPNDFPPGWDEDRVMRTLQQYERQTETEAEAEDEQAWETPTQAAMQIPHELVPLVRELLAKHRAA